jgi:hypothetical protein
MIKKIIQEKIDSLGGIEPSGSRPLRSEELKEIESYLGVRLPNLYRTLLLTFGAFDFKESVKLDPITDNPKICTIGFAGFYGAPEKQFDGLLYHIKRYWNSLPRNLIAIANNVFGDLICLGIRSKEKGKLYFWSFQDRPDLGLYWEAHGYDQPPPRELMFRNIHLIATSLEDFLMRLEVWEEAKLPPPPRKGKQPEQS